MKVTIESGSVIIEDAPPVDPIGMSEREAQTIAFLRAVVWATEQLAAELNVVVAGHQTVQTLATAMRKP